MKKCRLITWYSKVFFQGNLRLGSFAEGPVQDGMQMARKKVSKLQRVLGVGVYMCVSVCVGSVHPVIYIYIYIYPVLVWYVIV